MQKKKKEYLTEQERNLIKRIDITLDTVIEDYYLFIPIAILNERIDLEGFENKTELIYEQIKLLKEIKEEIKKL